MRLLPAIFFGFAVAAASASAQTITTPKEFFGFDVCEDYMLANYTQFERYWKKLDAESDRMVLVSIGKSENGRDQWMAIISDPANLRNRERLRQASKRLAMARDFKSDADARKFIESAKPVVWIDGGLHATETLGAQQLIETAYQLVSRDDAENRRILKDCIILLAHANPDGMELVSNWYMRRTNPTERSLTGVPELYQKYAGHDNNRDFYASNLAETRNINRVFYHEWFPQIVYNHHQTAPGGTVMFIPPFRNPFNFHMDPIVQIGMDVVGGHMHQRLIAQGKGGTVMRNGAPYSSWWNGGLRTTTYFHNVIGILTETFGTPNPSRINFSRERQVPTGDIPNPVEPGPWRMRQSLEYEVEANYAILDYASRYRDHLLFQFYRAGRNSIERGQRDNWTRYPSRVAAHGEEAIRRPEFRDARAYLMPPQADRGSLEWFLDRLRWTGIEVHRLTEAVSLDGRSFPVGTYMVRADQSYRPHILDMFEPQDHPNDFQYPGGPPIAPYDSAGYTLAYQMGIEFHRVLGAPPAAAERIDTFLVGAASPLGTGEVADFRDLDGYRRLFLALGQGARAELTDKGARLAGSGKGMPRVALWDRYGGSMESGWTRFMLERFNVPYTVIFAPDIDRGKLEDRFDIILLPGGAVPARDTANEPRNPLLDDPTIPAELKARMGSMTVATSVSALKSFVESGGHLVAIGSSALNLTRHWDLGVTNALVEANDAGELRPLPNTKFFIPGSVLRANVQEHSLTRGVPDGLDVIFDGSPSFKIVGATPDPRVTVLAVFDSDKPLRSGWAWGQERLKGTFAIVDVTLGKGKVVLGGPELTFRAQPSQSMKIVLNALIRAGR